MYKEDLALNDLQWLIYPKKKQTKPTNQQYNCVQTNNNY